MPLVGNVKQVVWSNKAVPQRGPTGAADQSEPPPTAKPEMAKPKPATKET